jgi:hypothetical protein
LPSLMPPDQMADPLVFMLPLLCGDSAKHKKTPAAAEPRGAENDSVC